MYGPSYPSNGARPPGWHLYTRQGQRKYLNPAERVRFIRAAQRSDPHTRTLCLTLAYTGCRLSEALSLTHSSVQWDHGVIAIKTLKQRGHVRVRELPVPASLVADLLASHGISQIDLDGEGDERLWPWGRTWGWQMVKTVMRVAEISGVPACPRGLRHGFGVHAVHSSIPLPLIQRWLGHQRLATTAIYTSVVGPEERALAERMWTH